MELKMKLFVSLSVVLLVQGDLLDLYVQHMDETMRTLVYEKQHPRNIALAGRIRRNANSSSNYPFFKKQGLEVDEQELAKEPNLGNDALNYPNDREENLDPSQHEVFDESLQLENVVEETTEVQELLENLTEEAVVDLDEIPVEEVTGGGFDVVVDEDSDREVLAESLKPVSKGNNRAPKKYIFDEKKLKKNSEKSRRSVAKFTRSEVLDDQGEVVLEWDPNDEEIVTFRITARTLGYVGIGFNDKSHMKGADLILLWVDDHSATVNVLDAHGIEEDNSAPVTDASQDIEILQGSQNETHTCVTFSRRWETCDPQDHELSGDTVRVLWAMHQTDPELNTAAGHGERRGSRALRLKAPPPHPRPYLDSPDMRHWDVKLNQFAVSDSMDTVYWCKIFRAPLLKKHHMVGYTPLVEKSNEALVHHIILYECASTLPILGEHARIAGAPCYSPTMPPEWVSCLQPVLAWARGSKGEWLPNHVGIPIAEHRENSYYMLEVHYNNPGLKKVIDSSGVRLHLSSNLRPEEAGILVAGVAVSPLHVVPPRQKEYATAGYCTPHCTNTMFPKDGINVVSVVLHSHLAGRRLGLKHVRHGKELPRIVQDNHFDFDYQQSHTLEKEVKVLPGDELIAECIYETLDRSKPTLGGYAASQEMCLAFIVHYPRTPLAACYSMTPVNDLFETLGVSSFRGVSVSHLEKFFLVTGTDAVTLPSAAQQQLPVYPATRPNDQVDEDVIKEAESVLKAMKNYSEQQEGDNVFARLVIEEPEEFRGLTFAEHMQAVPWSEELLARSIEKRLYHGRHLTFCRKRDDKLALPADIQNFPNFTALPEISRTNCSQLRANSAANVPGMLPTTFVATLLSSFLVFRL